MEAVCKLNFLIVSFLIFVALPLSMSSVELDIRGVRCEKFENGSTRLDYFARDDPEGYSIDFGNPKNGDTWQPTRSGMPIPEEVIYQEQIFGDIVTWFYFKDSTINKSELRIQIRHKKRAEWQTIYAGRIVDGVRVEGPSQDEIETKKYIFYSHVFDSNCNYRWYFYGSRDVGFFMRRRIVVYDLTSTPDDQNGIELGAWVYSDLGSYPKFLQVKKVEQEVINNDPHSFVFYARGNVAINVAQESILLKWKGVPTRNLTFHGTQGNLLKPSAYVDQVVDRWTEEWG